MSVAATDEEARLQQAVIRVRETENPNVTGIARDFGVDPQRLRRRVKGISSRLGRPAANRRLNDEQEQALCSYLDELTVVGEEPSMEMLLEHANTLLRDAPEAPFSRPAPVGREWGLNFLKRHPEYSVSSPKSKPRKRKRITDPELVEEWFGEFKELLDTYGFHDSDIWNMDETRFFVGMRKNLPVTVSECINGAGDVTAPLIMMKGKVHLSTWYMGTQMNNDDLVGVSDTGRLTDELRIDWFNHFLKQSEKHKKGEYRLLLLDEYRADCTPKFLEICRANKTIVLTFPEHITHLLQPLDLLFPNYHWRFDLAYEVSVENGCESFGKVEFLSVLHILRRPIFTPQRIKIAFREAGILPFRPSNVIYNLLDSLPGTPPPDSRAYRERLRAEPEVELAVEAVAKAEAESADEPGLKKPLDEANAMKQDREISS